MAKPRHRTRRASSKSKKTRRIRPTRARAHRGQGLRSNNSRGARFASRKTPKIMDPVVAQAFKRYDEAMRIFNQQNYRRAREAFDKVVAGPSRELAERARVHIAICEQRSQRQAPVHLRTADDYYHYAVSQINLRNYAEARSQLDKARKLAPKADYIYYALASVASLSGEADEAVSFLAQAIKLRPENRYHARNDADFKLLEDDSRFLALVSPARGNGPGMGAASA